MCHLPSAQNSDQTIRYSVAAGRPIAVLRLAIGTHKTATDWFHHNPPTPAELENAIQWVGDEVTRAHSLVAGHPAGAARVHAPPGDCGNPLGGLS